MIYSFDHFVHFSRNPENLAEQYNTLGLHIIAGGRHEANGTYNILSYFNLSYIEILGTFDEALVNTSSKEQHSLWTTLANEHFKSGITRIAIRTNNIEADASTFRQRKLEIEGPIPFQRKRPDGTIVSWKLLFIGEKNTSLPLPFLIQWDEDDESRMKDLTEQGAINNHPLGKVQLLAIGIAVNDMESTVNRWAQYLQTKIGPEQIDESLNAKLRSLALSGSHVTFFEPIGPGKVQTVIETTGEKPFLIELQNETKNQDVDLHGVTYRFRT